MRDAIALLIDLSATGGSVFQLLEQIGTTGKRVMGGGMFPKLPKPENTHIFFPVISFLPLLGQPGAAASEHPASNPVRTQSPARNKFEIPDPSG